MLINGTINGVLAGFEVRKGWHVNVDASHIHYDPDLYPDPTHFIPERFDVIAYK